MDISGIDKMKLLRALWEHQVVAGYFGGAAGPSFDETEAKKAVVAEYIDYFCGRPIKADLSGNTMSTWLYNRDSKKKAEDIIAELRK